MAGGCWTGGEASGINHQPSTKVRDGPIHCQLHMGCGKKRGSITFIHAQVHCLKVVRGNKKSGEIKPDG